MANTNPIDDESTNVVEGQADPDMAQPIRTEDQTASKGVQEISYAAGPPSYDSSVPLLSSSQQAGDEEVDTEAQAEARAVDQKHAYAPPLTLVAWLKFLVGMAPILTVCLSWAVLGSAGVDPLAFSLLSFFLLIGLFWFTVLVSTMTPFLQHRVCHLHDVAIHPHFKTWLKNFYQ